jgi:hypothetical protein
MLFVYFHIREKAVVSASYNVKILLALKPHLCHQCVAALDGVEELAKMNGGRLGAAAAALMMAVAMYSGGASAATTTEGTFINSFSGNDPFPSTLLDSEALYKQNFGDGASILDGPNASTTYTDDFTITVDAGGKSGTWTYGPLTSPQDDGQLFPKYMVLKAGTNYLLYDVSALTIGVAHLWDTVGLLVGSGQQPALSHITFYDGTGRGGGSDPTPLPAAAWFMLTALLGGAGYSKWRKHRGLETVPA